MLQYDYNHLNQTNKTKCVTRWAFITQVICQIKEDQENIHVYKYFLTVLLFVWMDC